MVLRPLASAGGVPLKPDRLERIRRCGQHLGFLALGVLNGVDPVRQEFQGLGAPVARRLEPQGRIAAERGQTALPVRPGVLKAPDFCAVGFHQQEQALAIEQRVILLARPGGLALGV
ncbi:hypothetical protein FQZ97_629250 [compost metagenome]